MGNSELFFQVTDYVIFALTIILSLAIGIFYAVSGGKQRTTSEFFVGNRKMAIIPVAISLMVSFESSIMMLGTPAEVYVYGLQRMIGYIGFFISNILSIFIVVPLIHPLKITSAYQYLEMRFESRAVRVLATFLGILTTIAYMGTVLFGPAIALEAVTGFPQWGSILSVALAAVIYTSIGGLKAVIWTDVFQFVVMFAGFFAVLIKGTMEIGGVVKTWEIAYNKGRINLFNFDTDLTVRHTFWNLFIGGIFRGFSMTFNQSSVQRISSTPTQTSAKKVLMMVAPGFFISMALASTEGIIAYGYYDTIRCDPLASKQISNPNQIIPYMVMDIFQSNPGMPGLFLASLFSASLSTLSSGLSSMSALFFTDIVKPHVKLMSEDRAAVVAKILVVIFGGLVIMVAFAIANVGGTLIQIGDSVVSAFGGPLAGLFLFGAFFPWGNSKGAFCGALISCCTTFVIVFGQMTTKGAVNRQKLAPAPTDSCSKVDISVAYTWLVNTTLGSNGLKNNTLYTYNVTEAIISEVPEPTGISRLFMLSYQWFGVVAVLQVLIIGSLVSLCTGYKRSGEVDRKYLTPFFDTLCPCLPECILRPFRCGYGTANKIDEISNDVPEEKLRMKIEVKNDIALDVKKSDTETNDAV